MSSDMSTSLVNFDLSQQKLQQLRGKIEKLKEEKELQENDDSFNEYQFKRQFDGLQEEIQNWKSKVEKTETTEEQQTKEELIVNIRTLSDQLSNLVVPRNSHITNDVIKQTCKKNIRDEKNVMTKIAKSENITEISSEDSSSDPDFDSEHAEVIKRNTMEQNDSEKKSEHQEQITESKQFIAVANFEAQDKNDLNLKQNDVVNIIATREDGWWLAENEKGKQGFVPKTFLKVHIPNEKINEDVYTINPIPRQKVTSETIKTSISPITTAENEQQIIISNATELSNKKIKQNEFANSQTNFKLINSNSEQHFETKILGQSALKSIEDSTQNLEQQKSSTTPMTLLYNASFNASEMINDDDDHTTYKCYLAPRLSESNCAFHDIYWNYEDDRLRKRRVRVNKLIEINCLEKICLNAIDVNHRLIRAYLIDQKNANGSYRIVSNVYTIKAHPRKRNQQTWIFSKKKNNMEKSSIDHPSFILRSNYKQKSVVLCLEAVIIYTDQEGEMLEKSLGCFLLPIINKKGLCCLQNKNYIAKLFSSNHANNEEMISASTPIQMSFRILNVPDNMLHEVDSLPDVILCNVLYVPMFFYYRRLLGQFLTKNLNSCNTAALKGEPFLSIFPAVADQPDMMEIIWKLWEIFKKKATKKLSELEIAEQFRSFFLSTAFILHQTVAMPEFSWINTRSLADRYFKLINFSEQYLHNYNAAAYLSKQRCHPINIFNYAVDIVGPHAIS